MSVIEYVHSGLVHKALVERTQKATEAGLPVKTEQYESDRLCARLALFLIEISCLGHCCLG